MATLPANDAYVEEIVEEPRGLTLAEILSGVNIAELLPPERLREIGQRVVNDVEIDKSSRGDWEDRYQRSLDVAMQVKTPKNFPWPGAANVKYPLLTVAAIQFQAEAYPVIVDGSNLVKGRVLGPDPEGIKRARADRMGQHMTWQLLYRMPGWEEDTDRLLLVLPIVGCMFRKSFFDAIENGNRSETVSALDFIINYWAKSIESAPRYTQVLRYYPYEVREKVAAGLWLSIPLDDDGENADADDDQALGEYYEQHRCLDLDGDGYPEHYVVTCTKEGDVARISPCFGPEGVTINMGGQLAKLDELLEQLGATTEALSLFPDLPIVKIERRQYFTKYGFIPAPDGSFYDIGFGTLLDDISATIDTNINQMLDAGALQNAGGGFLGSGVQVRGGNFKFALGEWKRVDNIGGLLKDNIVPMPAPGPATVLFSLLELLIQAARDITSSQDVVAGRAPANQPATTTLALLEQAQSVRKGIYKRIHRAFGKELRILRQLNREYLDEDEYFQLNDDNAAQIGRADYEDRDLDVVPVSDPGQVSDMQKMTRAQVLLESFNGDPLINQIQLRRDFLSAVGAKDIPAYFEVPQPQPDPKLVSEAERNAAAAKQSLASGAKSLIDAANTAVEIGLVEDAAALAEASVAMGAPNVSPDLAAVEPGTIPGMEGGPGDEGLLPVPEGAALGADAGVGPGSFDGAGTAGAGGDAGPTGGTEF